MRRGEETRFATRYVPLLRREGVRTLVRATIRTNEVARRLNRRHILLNYSPRDLRIDRRSRFKCGERVRNWRRRPCRTVGARRDSIRPWQMTLRAGRCAATQHGGQSGRSGRR